MKDKIEIEEYHKNHIKVKLKKHMHKIKNQKQNSQKSDMSQKNSLNHKNKSIYYKEILNNVRQ